jgi:hypothetical protein
MVNRDYWILRIRRDACRVKKSDNPLIRQIMVNRDYWILRIITIPVALKNRGICLLKRVDVVRMLCHTVTVLWGVISVTAIA